ncbi:CBO0543 family protein [Niallia sp. JL1B1071]|uniref:CBO0543 family protein n=1 Tax=Niallia tiangongensis TaxID=3237105 RepID=UPI0037DDD6C8
MEKNKMEKRFLRGLFIGNLLILLPILYRKPPIRDWIIVFVYNAITNGLLDMLLTSHKVIRYPVRFLPKKFKIHILFDFLIYPTFTVFYNELTKRDKLFAVFYKLILFTIPFYIIELWAERKTKLIKWKKGWKWYYSFLGIILKSLITRLVIEVLRKMNFLTR